MTSGFEMTSSHLNGQATGTPAEKVYLEEDMSAGHKFGAIVGESAALCLVLGQVEIVAPTDATVLICGETGTGKELLARALHELSVRQGRTFVKMNCAAIPTGLLESELFGHEKGAFTGAIAQKIGRFELAHQGTLFLDEVGDIPTELQPKLLRVLQEQEFERLGSTKTIKADVRLVAATNRDLGRMVADGAFRADLYYRLTVFPVVLPPLRERTEDIPRLVRHFTQRFAQRIGRQIETIPSAVMDVLVSYSWPGNIREMQNVIERAVILSPGPTLQVPLSDLQPTGVRSQESGVRSQGSGVSEQRLSSLTPDSCPLTPGKATTMADAQREHILDACRETGWVLSGPRGAAARLGVKRGTLQNKMRKLGISRPP
jgi:formate hydrogenlyase transcriptional activator